jgi:hypothetical protein
MNGKGWHGHSGRYAWDGLGKAWTGHGLDSEWSGLPGMGRTGNVLGRACAGLGMDCPEQELGCAVHGRFWAWPGHRLTGHGLRLCMS